MKQNQEVKEQHEDENKEEQRERKSFSSDEEEMRTRRQVKKSEINGRNVRSRQSVQTSRGSAENNTSFFSQVFSKSFLSMSSEFTFGDNSDKSSIF